MQLLLAVPEICQHIPDNYINIMWLKNIGKIMPGSTTRRTYPET